MQSPQTNGKMARVDVENLHGDIGFAIITIRDDETDAILDHLVPGDTASGRGEYDIGTLSTAAGAEHKYALVRCTSPGQLSAQKITNDLIEDLAPRLLVLVGIGGAVPSEDFTLGDVVCATRVADFSVNACFEGGRREFDVRGGPMHSRIDRVLGRLPIMVRGSLRGWNAPAKLPHFPPLSIPGLDSEQYYGSPAWKQRVYDSLQHHFSAGTSPRARLVTARTVASSDTLMKDAALLQQWQSENRSVSAIEMELGGVYVAAQADIPTPILAVRGLSDIVGLKRQEDWTKYACKSAASLAFALLASGEMDQFCLCDTPPLRHQFHYRSKERNGGNSNAKPQISKENDEPEPATLTKSEVRRIVQGQNEGGQSRADQLGQVCEYSLDNMDIEAVADNASNLYGLIQSLGRGVAPSSLLVLLARASLFLHESSETELLPDPVEMVDFAISKLAEETGEELEWLKALRDYWEARGGSAPAVKRLQQNPSPQARRLHLFYLICDKQFQSAHQLLHENQLDEFSVEAACMLYASEGDLANIQVALKYVVSLQGVKRKRSIFRLGQCLFNNLETGERVAPFIIESLGDECSKFLELPSLTVLESKIIDYYIYLHDRFPQGYPLEAKLFPYTMKRIASAPIDLCLVNFSLRHRVPVGQEVCERLLNEHPSDPVAELLSLEVERSLGCNGVTICERGILLLERLTEPSMREALARTVSAAAQGLEDEARKSWNARLCDRLDPDSKILHFLRAQDALEKGDLSRLEALLVGAERSAEIMQLEAALRFQQKRFKDAYALYRECAFKWPSPAYFRQAAYCALQGDLVDEAQETLGKALLLWPQWSQGREELAKLLIHTAQYADAVPHLEHLARLSSDPWPRKALADSLSKLGREEESLVILDQLKADVDSESPEMLTLLLQQASELTRLGRADVGLGILWEKREAFASNPVFWMEVLRLSGPSGNQLAQGTALSQLMQLKEAGKIPDSAFRVVDIEDMKDVVQSGLERNASACSLVLEGKLPWLSHVALNKSGIIRTWYSRTRPLRWLSKTPQIWAEGVLYTAEFPAGMDNGSAALHAPPPVLDSVVVIDFSTLLTLQRLGLLSLLPRVVNSIHFPTKYLDMIQEECDGLKLPSASKLANYKKIKTLIDLGRIKIATHPFDVGEEGTNVLHSVIEFMHRSGRLSDTEKATATAATLTSELTAVELQEGQEVLVDIDSIITLAELRILDKACDSVSLLVDSSDQTRLLEEIEDARVATSLHIEAKSLREFLISDAIVKPSYLKLESNSDGAESFVLAKSLKLGLLVDDRVVQRLMLGDSGTKGLPCHSSDRLIRILRSSGAITPAEALRSLLTLVQWRYRFIVLSGNELYAILLEHKSYPPGENLKNVTQYIHDCLTDPGLTCYTHTDGGPPTCAVLYLSWTSALSDFLLLIFSENDFGDVAKLQLADYIITTMRPPVPYMIQPNARCSLEENGQTAFLLKMSILALRCERTLMVKLIDLVKRVWGLSEMDLLSLGLSSIAIGGEDD